MWYRTAQLYDVAGKNLLEFGPFVQPAGKKIVQHNSTPQALSPLLNRISSRWSSITWNPSKGLQFWTREGKLIGSQTPGVNIFDTLRAFEPSRFSSDITDKIILDVYQRGKYAEQAIQKAKSQNPSLNPQQYNQILSSYMKEYYVNPSYDENGNLQNLPTHYPQKTPQEESTIRQHLQTEYLSAPKKPGESGFQFTETANTTNASDYRARYNQAYNQAYAEYESNGSKMPFVQWKKQFDDAFWKGYNNNSNTIQNQVTTQNQNIGTYQLNKDSVGNVSIVQSDGRVYAYIPSTEVPYQLDYIKKMTGKAP